MTTRQLHHTLGHDPHLYFCDDEQLRFSTRRMARDDARRVGVSVARLSDLLRAEKESPARHDGRRAQEKKRHRRARRPSAGAWSCGCNAGRQPPGGLGALVRNSHMMPGHSSPLPLDHSPVGIARNSMNRLMLVVRLPERQRFGPHRTQRGRPTKRYAYPWSS